MELWIYCGEKVPISSLDNASPREAFHNLIIFRFILVFETELNRLFKPVSSH